MNWQAVGVIFAMVTTIGNIILFVLVKFNDLKHLDENMKHVLSKLENVGERLAKMEGICSVCAKKSKNKR